MAAGLGFKTFTTGEVLTAADTNGYLMQGVLVFASAAARDAAITSPQEGQFAYLKDTNVTTYYTGSAWANLDTTGMTNPMTTTGDVIYSSPGSTPVRLGIGSTGNVLTVSGGVPVWSAPAGGGKVLQVVYGSTSTQVTNSTNSTVDTGLTATITPTSATSTILVLIGQQGIYKQNGNNSSGLKLILQRDGSTIYNISDIFMYNNTSSEVVSSISAVYRDSPATTSARTYKTVFSNYANAAAVGVQFVAGTLAMTSTITLLEIGA